jgi:hypothetical protein
VLQDGVGRVGRAEAAQQHLRQSHAEEREGSDEPRPVHHLLRRQEAFAFAERRPIGTGAIERDVHLHRRRPVRVGDRHRHKLTPTRHARIEHDGRLGRHRYRSEAAGRGQRRVVIVQQSAFGQRGVMLLIRQHRFDACGREHRRRLVRRRTGIDGDACAADPFDRQGRLDGRRPIPVPQSDATPGEAAADQCHRERGGAAPDLVPGAANAVGADQKDALAGILHRPAGDCAGDHGRIFAST